jgi:uncharacterized protein (DUF1697 family)
LSFQNVSTYKQSGNVIFETDLANPQDIKVKIEEKLHSTVGYEVATFVRTIPQLKSQEKEGTSFLVTFLAIEPPSFPLQFL